MKPLKSNTNLPIKGRVPDPELGESITRNELGMIFSRPPFSVLTSEHGFTAMLQTPFVRLPAGNLTGPGVSSKEQDSEVLDFLRFKSLKEEEEKNAHYEYKEIRCIIDLSTQMSFALDSAVGHNPAPLTFLALETLTLGEFQIDDEKFLLGIKRIRFFIHERPYTQNVKVAKELFPGHQGVKIQMVLGRDFLCAYPGLTLEPTFRQGSIDFVPWHDESRENGFDVNDKGELMVYVCGHLETTSSELHLHVPKDDKHHKREKGAYGVFFGPNSGYNMSLPTKALNFPTQEAALIEGIMAVAYLVIKGGFIYGTPTFTSVRVLTDSQLVVDLLNPGGKLAEYQERDWRNKQGKKLGFWEALEYWCEVVCQELEPERVVWMKNELFTFEKAEKKTKGLQAARYLAQCGLKFHGGLYPCKKDFGDAQTSDKYNKKKWKELEFDDMLYINTLDTSCTLKMLRVKKIDFVDSRVQANAKAIRQNTDSLRLMTQNPIQPTAFSTTHAYITSFFQTGAVCRFEKFTSTLSHDKILSAMQLLEILDWSFLREVLRITKEERGLQSTLEFFKEGNGNIHFFHTARERTLLGMDSSPLESSCYSGPSSYSISVISTEIADTSDVGVEEAGPSDARLGGSGASDIDPKVPDLKSIGVKDASASDTDPEDTDLECTSVGGTGISMVQID